MAPGAAANTRGEAEITLGLLTAIDRDSAVTQRSIAQELGVALGLANAYLRRCVKKGLVKIQQVPRRRYAYYLTPHGFAEKARLTAEYLSSSLQFFRRARGQLSALMAECAARGRRRIALAGVSELAEIAAMCAHDHDVVLVAVIEPEGRLRRFAGLRVAASLAEAGAVDAVLVTDMQRPAEVAAALAAELEPQRVLVPQLLERPRAAAVAR